MQAIKIILDDNSKGRISLDMKLNLKSIRNSVQDKVKENFIFLDIEKNDINPENENNLTVEEITKDKMIYLKKVENETTKIKIMLQNNEICTINYSETQKVSELRNILKDKIKEDFIFLDEDEIDVDIQCEHSLLVSEILKDYTIKIKANNSTLITPSNEEEQKELNKMENKEQEEFINKKDENINIIKDFSQYDILEKMEDLTIYKYSNIKGISKHENVYEYYYDKLDERDIKDATVMLFCGKTGHGKTTALNAIFNIIKGIKLEDNYRFILITEIEKKTGQAESQTDGVHLYYLKDYNNKPVILIDSQGYDDTRNTKGDKNYDHGTDEAFSYVFSEIISHVNAAVFIIDSKTIRIDASISYIFASVTKLFAEDISQNFIVLATKADKYTIKSKPPAISSLETQEDFSKTLKKLRKNWWYLIDSRSLLENDFKDNVTIYSFKSAVLFYKDITNNLTPRCIEKSSEVLKSRIESRILVEQLHVIFHNLIMQQDNLESMEKNIDKKIEETKRLERNLNDLENDMNRLDPKELEEKLSELNNEVNRKLDDFLNEKVDEIIQTLEPVDYHHTICHSCKKNCHIDCQCLFSLLGRCKIFTFFTKRCEVCGCHKDSHKRDKYRYVFIKRQKQKYTDYEISQEKVKNEGRKKKILIEMDKNNNARNSLEKKINEFNTNKKILMLEQEKINREKDEIKKKIKDINNQIIFTIIKLQGNYEKIEGNAMVPDFTKKEDDYIDDLINKMDTMNIRERDKFNKIKQIKENNRIFRQTVKIDKKDLMKLDDAQLAGLLKIIIPNYKK